MGIIDSFVGLMDKGGPVMWVIFITAWAALILLTERTLKIQSWLRHAEMDLNGLQQDKNYQPSEPRGRKASPLGIILHSIHWEEVKTKVDLVKQFNTHLGQLMPHFEGMLPTIAIIGSILPMLGLLGTVTGMIEVFEVIALHGTGDPQEMAHGISQALLTTASGLIIAIPVIFSHHLLVRRLRLMLSLTEQSMHLVQKRELKISKEVSKS
ncbi:MAG: MotA/TolQ/ExbB proton channel family protein [Gammaproteobacteria bacterium]|nr:MotA/TolQ/ExbB proton channel family protein [Gammaproteobacteria bacterium]MDH5729300.1 MotA/TolQ/ExbB proton channel family protein [Gammaproteobacteria bacterium]